jgi:hypothetical protein
MQWVDSLAHFWRVVCFGWVICVLTVTEGGSAFRFFGIGHDVDMLFPYNRQSLNRVDVMKRIVAIPPACPS